MCHPRRDAYDRSSTLQSEITSEVDGVLIIACLLLSVMGWIFIVNFCLYEGARFACSRREVGTLIIYFY